MFDPIIALATPPMKGALAVIRISGDKVKDIVQECFTGKLNESHKVKYGFIINPDSKEKIDEVMVTYFQAPRSYTGEDSIEISCHGSMLIADQIISLFLSRGVRNAERGEFTSRAYYNGRIDLVQAEAVNEMINAKTNEAKKLSLYSLTGETSSLLIPIKTKLADILSLIEVNIDYPEYEDIEQVTNEKIELDVGSILSTLKEIIKEGESAKLIKEGINVALVGRPNVGKSSLLNALVNEEKAIVTSIPGTTRDIVEGQINLNGLILNLLDTAGIREADNEVEQIGIERSRKSIDDADLVILVLEADKLTDEDKELLELTKDKKRIVIYNKKDLVDKLDEDKIYISAKNKDIVRLQKEISKLFSLDKLNELSPSLCSAREIGLLQKARKDLEDALKENSLGMSLDLVSVGIKAAYDDIRTILGEEVSVDLSSEIFSRFCVGK